MSALVDHKGNPKGGKRGHWWELHHGLREETPRGISMDRAKTIMGGHYLF